MSAGLSSVGRGVLVMDGIAVEIGVPVPLTSMPSSCLKASLLGGHASLLGWGRG